MTPSHDRSDERSGTQFPLHGLLVADLSAGIAGGYCSKVLADAGAEVVKIEAPGGDFLRRWSASGSAPADSDGALFQFLSCSKRSITADLGDAADDDMVRHVVAMADVVLWTPDGVAGQSQEFTPEALSRLAPSAPVVSITPFGLHGPWKDRASTEATLQAMSGGPALRGDPQRPPVLAGGRLGEWITGMFAAVALLASHYRSQDTGVGEVVDVSAFEAMTLSMTPYDLTFREIAGRPWRAARMANLPDIHQTKDGFVGFMVVTGQQWLDFAAMIEHPDWADDPSLGLMVNRAQRRDELLPEIDKWTSERTTAEIVEFASLMRIPVAEVGDGQTIPDMEQFAEREFFLTNPSGGFLQPDVPYRLGGGASRRPPGPSPLLGEHTDLYRRITRVDGEAKHRAGSRPAAALPFEGLRVADFTAFWAGPIVGQYLSMLGADVIHVESVQRPDAMRNNSVKKLSEDLWWEWAPLFQAPNTNKRDVTLDMSSGEGRRLARDLVAQCDVLIENYSPRVMENWGLDEECLRALKPDLIAVRMPAFGLSGPWRDRVGFAQTMEQISGLAFLTGFADTHPVTPNGPCDPIAGMHAVIALLLGLEHHRRTGEGMHIESVMIGGALNLAAEQLIEYSAYGQLLQRQGNRSPWAAPQGIYRAADRTADGNLDTWVVIAIEADAQWAALVSALDDPPWALATDLASAEGRRRAHDMLDEKLSAWCAPRTSDEIVDTLVSAGVPAAPVLFAHGHTSIEQLHSRGFIEEVHHPITGMNRHVGFPARFGNGPKRVHHRPAPTLGQHNREVLCDLLGVEPAELDELEAAGVIGTRPRGTGAW